MKKFATALIVAAGLCHRCRQLPSPPRSARRRTSLHVQGLFTPAQYYGGGGYGYRQHCWYERRCSGYYPYQRCWRERVCR